MFEFSSEIRNLQRDKSGAYILLINVIKKISLGINKHNYDSFNNLQCFIVCVVII